MKHTKELAYLRQLCCLSLPKEALLPEFLNKVKSVIPSNFNMLNGTDSQFIPTYCIPETPVNGLDEIYPETNRLFWTKEKMLRCMKWISSHATICDIRIVDENYKKTEMYNVFFFMLNIHHMIHTPVTCNGAPVGMLTISRPRSARAFNYQEETLWVYLATYVSHALQTQNTEDIQYCENGVTGMMVMDTDGKILFQSETAQRLLVLANNPLIPTDTFTKTDVVMPKLAQLCRNLENIFQGNDAAPPSWCHTNGLGRFIFRAYWLDRDNKEPGGLIGMTIEHQEPLALKILRAMQDLPLSPVQKEVALLLAQGVSSEKIGERLHIKYTTVKDHVRKIFDKLDIHQREELLPKLLGREKERLIQLV
jgi:DNA-binding CsgD family transcriptional regulator